MSAYRKERIKSDTGLPVFKFVCRLTNADGSEINNIYMSPYQRQWIAVPSTVKAKGRCGPHKSKWIDGYSVGPGMIHCYRDDGYGLLQIKSQSYCWHDRNEDLVLLHGIIPAGVPFIVGRFGEVCAKTVRFVSVAASNDTDNMMRVWNYANERLAGTDNMENLWQQITDTVIPDDEKLFEKEMRSCAR